MARRFIYLECFLIKIINKNKAKKSLVRKTISNNSDPKNKIIHQKYSFNNKKEPIKNIIQEDIKTEEINLDEIWKKVIAMLELPSTKMLLSQQAKLINLNSDSAEIAISEKWINMIESRKILLKMLFIKREGSSTKVLLINKKTTLSNKEREKRSSKIEQKNQFKIDTEARKKNLQKVKIEKNNRDKFYRSKSKAIRRLL